MYIQHLMIFRTFAPAFQKRITDKKKKNMRLSLIPQHFDLTLFISS